MPPIFKCSDVIVIVTLKQKVHSTCISVMFFQNARMEDLEMTVKVNVGTVSTIKNATMMTVPVQVDALTAGREISVIEVCLNRTVTCPILTDC